MKFLPLLLLLLFACSKKNDNSQSTQPDPQNLAPQFIGSWKVIAETSDKPYDWNGDGTTETDYYSVMSACEKSEVMQYSNDGTGLVSRSGACTWSLPMKWRINNNSTELRCSFYSNGWAYYGPEVTYKIISMNGTTFTVNNNIQPAGAPVFTMTTTYKKQ